MAGNNKQFGIEVITDPGCRCSLKQEFAFFFRIWSKKLMKKADLGF